MSDTAETQTRAACSAATSPAVVEVAYIACNGGVDGSAVVAEGCHCGNPVQDLTHVAPAFSHRPWYPCEQPGKQTPVLLQSNCEDVKNSVCQELQPRAQATSLAQVAPVLRGDLGERQVASLFNSLTRLFGRPGTLNKCMHTPRAQHNIHVVTPAQRKHFSKNSYPDSLGQFLVAAAGLGEVLPRDDPHLQSGRTTSG